MFLWQQLSAGKSVIMFWHQQYFLTGVIKSINKSLLTVCSWGRLFRLYVVTSRFHQSAVYNFGMTAWTMKIIVLWNVTPCSLSEIYRRFGEPYYHYIHSKQPWESKTTYIKNGGINLFHTKESHIPDDANFHFRKFGFVSHYFNLHASSLTPVYIFKCLHVIFSTLLSRTLIMIFYSFF
jgi:hypothetical protein